MSNKLRTILLAIPVLAVSTAASADVFVFEAATDNVYLTLNGTTVTGNGGRITDFTVNGDLISFDLALSPGGYADVAAYTNLLDPGADDS